jgi:hypothetical protein
LVLGEPAESPKSVKLAEQFKSAASVADRQDEALGSGSPQGGENTGEVGALGRNLWGLLVLVPLLVGGCAIHKRAQNPLPGVFRVAVVDFVDKTNGAEGLSTAKLTETFASELQKVPSYEVVPVQEVREVLGPARIDTNQPQLAFELARAVHAQAIIIGSVNEYRAQYPPRVALHCELYAMVTGQPEAVVVSPEIEVEKNRQPISDLLSPLALPMAGVEKVAKGRKEKHCHGCGRCWGCKHGKSCSAGHGIGWKLLGRQTVDITPQANSPDPNGADPNGAAGTGETPGSSAGTNENPPNPEAPIQPMSAQQFTPDGEGSPAPKGMNTSNANSLDDLEDAEVVDDTPVTSKGPPLPVEASPEGADAYLRGEIPAYRVSVKQAIDPVPVVEPWVIRHSRVFDGTNVGLMRKLRDYYFFNDDLRGGDWQGYVIRNEDFVRFACNQMIYEMLEAAGGDWKTLRGIRIAQPWIPYPPR